MSEMLDAIKRYMELGLEVLPYTNEGNPLMSFKEISSFSRDIFFDCIKNVNDIAALSVVLGLNGSQYWVLAARGEKAIEWANKNACPTPVTAGWLEVKHFYYKSPSHEFPKTGYGIIGGLPPGNRIDAFGVGSHVRVPPSKQIYTIKFEWRYGISDSHFSKIPTWPQPDFNGHDWPLANGPLFNPDLADLPLSECPDFTPGLVGQRRKRANEILRCLTKLKVCPLRIERILFKWNKANTFPLHDNTITHILLDYYNNLSKNEKENV